MGKTLRRLTDEKYLAGLLDRQAPVVEEIYDAYFTGVSMYVEQRGGSREDAEDVFQDALVVVYRQLKSGRLHLTSSFHTYLFGVAKKIWLNKQQRRGNQFAFADINEVTLAADATEIFEQTEQYRLYRAKFKLLGHKCQELLRYFLAGVSMREIARKMGYRSEGFVKKKKFKCKQKLVDLVRKDPAYRELK